MKHIINGKVYILQPVEMGVWEIITPSSNNLRFANKDKALQHINFLKGVKA